VRTTYCHHVPTSTYNSDKKFYLKKFRTGELTDVLQDCTSAVTQIVLHGVSYTINQSINF